MATCYQCGDKIEFRWIDGALRPIHVNGGWCSGNPDHSSGYAQSSFYTVQSYLDPNARCPVCGAAVFFYRSPHNGSVFFDNVGWPWPKHPCTDKYSGRDNQVRRPVASRFKFVFRSGSGQLLEVFRLTKFDDREFDVLLQLKSVERRTMTFVAVSRLDMHKKDITVEDFDEAPSLVLPRERSSSETEISFLSARLQSIVVLPATLEPS